MTKAEIQLVRALADKRGRTEHGLFVAEGEKLIGELRGSHLKVRKIFALEGVFAGPEVETVAPRDMERLSLLKTAANSLAIVETPRYALDMRSLAGRLTLALDDVQNPGNLGTIVRLADWFGIADIICSEASADCFNPKVVQATMGAILRVRVHYTDLGAFLHDAGAAGLPVYGTFLEGENIYGTTLTEEGVVVMGNEGRGISQAAARAVSLTAEAAEVLRSVSLDDLARCRDEANPHALRIPALLRLIPARQAWCLRTWMQEEGMQLPNRARLEEGLRQVRQSHADSQLALQVRSKEMRRWGDLLVIRDVSPRRSEDTRDAVLVWEGGDTLALPGWNGSLAVIPCLPGECGVSARRLRDGTLEVRARRGAERMKLWPNRPSKYLKDLFAEAGVPAFERADLPLVWLDGELVFTGALGMDIRFCDELAHDDTLVRFEFRSEASLLGAPADRPNLADRPASERRGGR